MEGTAHLPLPCLNDLFRHRQVLDFALIAVRIVGGRVVGDDDDFFCGTGANGSQAPASG